MFRILSICGTYQVNRSPVHVCWGLPAVMGATYAGNQAVKQEHEYYVNQAKGKRVCSYKSISSILSGVINAGTAARHPE